MSRAMRRLQWKSIRSLRRRSRDTQPRPHGPLPTWADYLVYEARQLQAALSRDKRT